MADSEDLKDERKTRRRYLALLAPFVTSGLSGCGGTGATAGPAAGIPTGDGNESTRASINPKPYLDAFDTKVNMRDAGANAQGEHDVTPVIENELDDNTMLYFPPGRYRMDSGIRRVGLENVAIIGQNATLVHGSVTGIHGFDVTSGQFSGPAQLFKIGIPETPHQGNFLFGGFRLDWRAKNTGMQVLNHHTAGTSEIRNIQCVGIHALGCQGPFRLHPATPDAKILAKDIDIRHGGLTYQNTINTRDERSGGGTDAGRSWATTGVAMHPEALGHLRLLNVWCGGWPDNGLYCLGGHPKGDMGTVEMINCVAANSQASNIRIGGDGSLVQGCVMMTDNSFNEEDDFYFEQRPLRIDDGDVTVKDSKIVQKKPTGWSITIQHAVRTAVLDGVEVSIYDEPELGLVVDPGPRHTEVRNMTFNTYGWSPSRNQLIRGSADVMENITVNGNRWY